MSVTTHEQWLADGSPWRPAPVIAEFAELLRHHGYVVYTLGNQEHLTADIPEDHTPYSHTPWPGSQPYPQVLALDVMPGGPVDWRDLGQHIVDARNGNWPGTGWIKYVNFTDRYGRCWHASWEPGYAVRSSGDTGHIHISARTDRIGDRLQSWDPVAALLGHSPTPTTHPQGDDMLTNWATIGRGATGDPARVAQGLLIAKGLPVGSANGLPDGDFGPTTEASTRALQSRYGIGVDGLFGPKTLSCAVYGRVVA